MTKRVVLQQAGKVEAHRAFWSRQNRKPLIGVVVGGWSRFLENPGADAVWGEGALSPETLQPERFVEDNRNLLKRYDELGDDLFHTAQPFPAIPWLEAIAGCRIRRSSHHLWAEAVPGALDSADRINFDPSNPWVRKYVEFLDALSHEIGPGFAVGQSVVRGPIDVASALLGETEMALACSDAPEKVRRLLERLAALAEAFLRHQAARIPALAGGTVMGQFEVWAPGWALRLQEDAVSLLSPRLYREFLAPLDAKLFALSRYNMFHMHTTSLHVLPDLLQVAGLGAVEVSKDEGVQDVAGVLPALKKIQAAGHPLVIKGRLSEEETRRLLRELQPEGLCVQAVVDTWEEGARRLSSIVP